MSLTGAGSFGNYDLTAQNTGLPILARQTTHDNGDDSQLAAAAGGSSPARNDDLSGTRATSVTEIGESETPRHKKAETPGAETDTISSDEDEDQIEVERRNSIVQALARKYTSQSHAGAPGANPFVIASQDEDSPLNPNGKKFNARAWAKTAVEMVSGEGHQFRTTGVAYQHLNVYGFGTPTDFQKDFLNVWLEGVGLARKLIGRNANRRIDILRDFDGVVRKGEMLVVLGPPGSGCSTFLKTIAGEHSGIFINDNSYFNYQGEIPPLVAGWPSMC